MAQRTIVQLTDDLDGKPIAEGRGETVRFALDRQDYEIEMFWAPSPGKMFHVYGMWRDVKIGSVGLTLDDNGLMNMELDGLVSWDDKTAKLCPMQ